MQVAHISCPECGDEWDVPNVDEDDIKEDCRHCGGPLDVSIEEVA